jgi:hypothetical protein
MSGAQPEPMMPASGPAMHLRDMLREPIKDRNFRSLVFMLGAWNLVSNFSAPS